MLGTNSVTDVIVMDVMKDEFLCTQFSLVGRPDMTLRGWLGVICKEPIICWVSLYRSFLMEVSFHDFQFQYFFIKL